VTTADARIIKLTELRQDLEKARRRRQAHDREQASIAQRVEDARHNARDHSQRSPHIAADSAARQDTAGDKFRATVGSKTFTERGDFGERLLAEAESRVEQGRELKDVVIGAIGGFDIVLSTYKVGNKMEWRVGIMREGNYAQDVE